MVLALAGEAKGFPKQKHWIIPLLPEDFVACRLHMAVPLHAGVVVDQNTHVVQYVRHDTGGTFRPFRVLPHQEHSAPAVVLKNNKKQRGRGIVEALVYDGIVEASVFWKGALKEVCLWIDRCNVQFFTAVGLHS